MTIETLVPKLPAVGTYAYKVLAHIDKHGPDSPDRIHVVLYVSRESVQKALRLLKARQILAVVAYAQYGRAVWGRWDYAGNDGPPRHELPKIRLPLVKMDPDIAPPIKRNRVPRPLLRIAPADVVQVWTPTGPALAAAPKTVFHNGQNPWQPAFTV